MKEYFIIMTKDWFRHGKYSGYEVLLKYLDYKFKIFKGFKLPYRFIQYFKIKTRLINYNSINFSKELSIIFKILKNKNIHILYGDMDYYYLHYIKYFPFSILETKLTATFHHPPIELEKRLKYNKHKVLDSLDKIIVMGSNQIPFFKKYSNAEIKFIPHGIDTAFFKPLEKHHKKLNQILIVGISHRDHDRNIKIIKEVSKLKLEIDFLVIMSQEFTELYKNISSVKIITNIISDKELLHNYQVSKGILLSLNDCTASNTILEGLATGCALITNNVGAVKDYVPSSSGIIIFETNQINDSVIYIKRLITDDIFLNDISKKQRDLAMQYDWHKIADITKKFILN